MNRLVYWRAECTSMGVEYSTHSSLWSTFADSSWHSVLWSAEISDITRAAIGDHGSAVLKINWPHKIWLSGCITLLATVRKKGLLQLFSSWWIGPIRSSQLYSNIHDLTSLPLSSVAGPAVSRTRHWCSTNVFFVLLFDSSERKNQEFFYRGKLDSAVFCF